MYPYIIIYGLMDSDLIYVNLNSIVNRDFLYYVGS